MPPEAPVPSPPEPDLPPLSAPVPLAVNVPPPQAYAVKEHSVSRMLTRNQWLRRLDVTASTPKKGSAEYSNLEPENESAPEPTCVPPGLLPAEGLPTTPEAPSFVAGLQHTKASHRRWRRRGVRQRARAR